MILILHSERKIGAPSSTYDDEKKSASDSKCEKQIYKNPATGLSPPSFTTFTTHLTPTLDNPLAASKSQTPENFSKLIFIIVVCGLPIIARAN